MQVKSGFTLVELMVALAAASILSLSVLAGLGRFQTSVFHLRQIYSRETEELFLLLRCTNPYEISCACALDSRKLNSCKQKTQD